MIRSLICLFVIVVSLLNKAVWDNAIVNGVCIAIAVGVTATLLIQRDRQASS